MNREEALDALGDASLERRLDAARTLEFLAAPIDEPVLTAALAGETSPWVRRALERVLTHSHSTEPDESDTDLSELDPAMRKAHLQSVRDL